MRYSAALLVLLPLWVSVDARAEMVAFSGRVDIRASVGTSPESFELLSVAVSGFAEIDAGAVRIQAGALSVPVPTLSGFGGNLALAQRPCHPAAPARARTVRSRAFRRSASRAEASGV